MNSPLVAIRDLELSLDQDVFRIELGLPREYRGIIFLLRDNGNVVAGTSLAFALREHGYGTAVCDLLTPVERARAMEQRKIPINTELLARRLTAAVDAVGDVEGIGLATAGITASGSAAAAALRVTALRPLAFDAVICRHSTMMETSGLECVRAATLFLAVAGDLSHIRPMTRAFQRLQCAKHFEILPSGAEAFDDAHTFSLASERTCWWLTRHLGATSGMSHGPTPLRDIGH